MSGASAVGEVCKEERFNPSVVLPAGFILQTSGITFGPFDENQTLHKVWLETQGASAKTQGCILPHSELPIKEQLVSDVTTLDFTFKMVGC